MLEHPHVLALALQRCDGRDVLHQIVAQDLERYEAAAHRSMNP